MIQACNCEQHAPLGTNWDKHALITCNGKEPRNDSFRYAERYTQQRMEGRATRRITTHAILTQPGIGDGGLLLPMWLVHHCALADQP
jgi:hypothetical protein